MLQCGPFFKQERTTCRPFKTFTCACVFAAY